MNPTPPRDYDAASMAMRDLLSYVVEPLMGERVTSIELKQIRNRAVALAWTLNPDIVGGGSATQIARKLGLNRSRFSDFTVLARRRFGIRNRYHAHDWRRKI